MGPIGLLISRIHGCAAYTTADLIVKAHPYLQFDVLHCAKQHLKRHVDDLTTIALSYSVKEARSMFKECGVLDKPTDFRTIAALDEDHKIALQRLHVQAHWSDAQQAEYFEVDHEGKCFHCKQEKGSTLHLWECPALKEFRESIDPTLAKLNDSNTPAHLLIGIPDELQAGNTGWLCRPPPRSY